MSKCVLINGQNVKKEIELAPCTVREACIQICGEQEFKVPVVAMLNGEPVLRKENGWENARVGINAVLIFVELPLGGGGGGSNGLQMVAQLAVVALAAAATWYLGGAGGVLVASLGKIGAAVVGSVVGAAIMMAGTMAINAVFGQKAQNLDAPESAEAASPTYSVNASGNTARLNQAEGEGFGLMKIVPDYIAQSYTEYSSNDQYAHFVYGLGRGLYTVKQMFFGDTKFWDESEGGFVESGFVSEDGEEYSHSYSQTLAVGGDWSGPYPAVASGAWAKTLRVTVNFPDGYGIETETTTTVEDVINGDPMNGNLSTRTVTEWEDKTATILIQYAEIDDSGAVVGNWSSTKTFTAKRDARRTWRAVTYETSVRSFSKTISFKASSYKRWAIRIKNGSEHIPHPQIQQYVIGQGNVWVDDPDATVYETMKFTGVASTAISITYQFVPSGDKVTRFPDNINVSAEVSGLDIPGTNDEEYPSGGGWIGPYAANEAGTATTEIKIDYAYATGLGRYKDNGGITGYHVYPQVQARKINDSGSSLGDWFELGSWCDYGSTTTPQRMTRSFKVDAGRYLVRMRRTDETHKDATPPSLDKLQWIGLRAVLPGSLTYPQFAIALRIKATNALSQQASQQFRVLAQRKLPVWDSTTRTWSEPQETRSWAAAVSAVCQEPWGGRMADRQIDLDTLWAIGARLDAKGWHCDCYVDGMYSMWQLIVELCQMVMVVPRLEGAVLSFIEDEPNRPVVYELNARNVVRGSFQVTYNTWSSDSPDDVILNYLDADAGYQQRDVQASLPDSESLEPTTLDWIGITDRTHAYRVAVRYAAMNRWRRISVTCQVEALGRLLNVGDVVSVNHPRFNNTQAGAVTGWNEASLKIFLESDFSGDASSASYISLVRPDGTVWGPVQVASITDGECTLNLSDYSAYRLQGNDNPFQWLKDGTASQPTTYALHASRNFQRRMLVQSIATDDLWHYTLTLCNDAPEVADYDSLPVPAWNGRAQTSVTLNAPSGLVVKWTAATGIATVVWRAVRGAVQYEVQHSADGVTWLHDGITTATSMPIMNASALNWSGNGDAGTVFVRVATISNTQRSAWTEWPEDLDPEIWDVFVVAGQSNAVGTGSYTLTASSEYGEFYNWKSSSPTYRQFIPLADPVYVSSRGGAWPWFADKYYAVTSRRCIILNIGSGGSAVTDYGTTTNTWANNGYGTLRSSRAVVMANAMADLKADGRKFRIAGMLWCQGEAEGGRIYAGQVDVEDYKAGTIDIWSWFRTKLRNQNLPIIVSQIGYSSGCFSNASRKAAYEQVQTAQTELCDSQANVYIGFTGAKNFYDENGNAIHMSDGIHYDEAGYKMMGEALAVKAVDVV